MSHPGVAHVPEIGAWIAWWTWDPLVLAGLTAGMALYTHGARRLWREAGVGHGIAPWRAAAYGAGIVVIAIALVSPLDRASDVLFSAHMVQHELLMLVAAPLIVLGRPLVPLAWSLPRGWRVRIARTTSPARIGRIVTSPVIALGLHVVTRLVWHVPALFNAALADERLHAIQHLGFFVTAVVFWWALIYGRYGRAGYGVGVVFVFFTMLYSGLLGAVLSLGDHALYAHATPTLGWGIDPVADQQRAGLLMWVPACVTMMAVGLAIFAAWLGQSARRVGRSPHPSLAGKDAPAPSLPRFTPEDAP
ncbi:MAG TPA: cytochrome c oxidase assembly protein [Kofleriaceae bacterium]|jgi:putative membrane protein|nr:cytochrome c oxidase assembly protein [Kofleriaceae bacterium]